MAEVVGVSLSDGHVFTKSPRPAIELVAGMGVAGDAHMGCTVKHRSRVAKNPDQPNLRQVHLIHLELLEELGASGFDVYPGALGENITTRNLPLLDLPTGTRLVIGEAAVVEITGLRNPCKQLDDFQSGLMNAVLDRTEDGGLIRKSGVMGVVLAGGRVGSGDRIRTELPSEPHLPLTPV